MDIKEINNKIIELQDKKTSFLKRFKINKEVSVLYEKRNLLLTNENKENVTKELDEILKNASLNELNNFIRNHEDYYGKTFVNEYQDLDPTIKEIIYYLYLLKYVPLDINKKEKVKDLLFHAKGDFSSYLLENKSVTKLTNYIMNKSMEIFKDQIKNFNTIDHFLLYDIFKD